MLKLLETYSVNEILIFLATIALAIKGCVDFIIWAIEKYKEKFDKDYSKKRQEEEMSTRFRECAAQRDQILEQYRSLNEKLDQMAEGMNSRVGSIEAKLAQLTKSDMHAIKGWIVEKHHELLKKGWVDDFTMDTLERRYNDYKAENGNSYVAELMEDLRELPHYPPDRED